MRYRFRPLGPWTGPSTPPAARKRAAFRATYPATLELLSGEADKLGARELVLQVDIAERWIRTDGVPYANARYGSHPGVIVSFGSAFGPLATADEALRWMRGHYAANRGWAPEDVAQLTAKDLTRRLARMLHPDAGGADADWERLDAARQQLTAAGLL